MAVEDAYGAEEWRTGTQGAPESRPSAPSGSRARPAGRSVNTRSARRAGWAARSTADRSGRPPCSRSPRAPPIRRCKTACSKRSRRSAPALKSASPAARTPPSRPGGPVALRTHVPTRPRPSVPAPRSFGAGDGPACSRPAHRLRHARELPTGRLPPARLPRAPGCSDRRRSRTRASAPGQPRSSRAVAPTRPAAPASPGPATARAYAPGRQHPARAVLPHARRRPRDGGPLALLAGARSSTRRPGLAACRGPSGSGFTTTLRPTPPRASRTTACFGDGLRARLVPGASLQRPTATAAHRRPVSRKRKGGVERLVRRPQPPAATGTPRLGHQDDERPPQAEGLSFTLNRRRPTLPGPCGPSTIGAEGLNCSVRKGKRCFPLAIATGNS